MITILMNDFCEILFDKVAKTIFQKWLRVSENMSEQEFTEQMDTLFSSIEVYEPEVLVIDALNFNYRIDSKSSFSISQFLSFCKINSLVVVLSNGFTGRRSILSLKGLEAKIANLKVVRN